MPLWQRLPVVKVLLQPEDEDVPLDLQTLVEQCWRNCGYEGTINYAIDPDPPLLHAKKDCGRTRKRRGAKGKNNEPEM